VANRGDVARLLRSPRARGLRPTVGGRGRMWPGAELPLLVGTTSAPPAPPVPASESEAMALPPFGRGLDLIAGTIAGLGWWAMSWDAKLGIWQRTADQPQVLLDPDPMTTPWHYRMAAGQDLVIYGNHVALYGEMDWRTNRPGWLAPVPPEDVWLLIDASDPAVWTWAVGGATFTPDEVLHVSAGNLSGRLLGRGVLAQYADWLGGAVAAEYHAASYFAGGALPPAVLQSPQVLTDPQAAELKTKWRAMTSTREPVILPIGYVLTPLVSNAEQNQLVQSRTWDADLVAMLLGIPSWKLGLQGPSMTYQNVDQADIVWIQDTVDRWGQPMTAAFSKWLMPRGTVVRWDYAARQRADQKTTAETLKTYTDAGILQIDEARSVIGRPPLAQATGPGTTPAGVPELTPQEVA